MPGVIVSARRKRRHRTLDEATRDCLPRLSSMAVDGLVAWDGAIGEKCTDDGLE